MKWFKHDSDARTDTKILRLRMRFGMAGYGVFWALVELLADSETRTIQRHELEAIAFDLRVELELMNSIVNEMVSSSLLIEDETGLFSPSLNKRLTELEKAIEQKREQAREAGKKSAEKRKKKAGRNDRSTTVEENSNDRSTTVEENSTESNISYPTVLDPTVLTPNSSEVGVGRHRAGVPDTAASAVAPQGNGFLGMNEVLQSITDLFGEDWQKIRRYVLHYFKAFAERRDEEHPEMHRNSVAMVCENIHRAICTYDLNDDLWLELIERHFEDKSWTADGERDLKIQGFCTEGRLKILYQREHGYVD